ncbi:unnamed protein product [Closterium sp. NIES-54]
MSRSNARSSGNLSVTSVGSAASRRHQTPLWLEMPATTTVDQTGVRSVPIRSAGYQKERVTVMLACTADGMKLKPWVLFKRKTVPKGVFSPVHADLIKRAFLTCGISNALDDSEDGLAMAHRQSQLTAESEGLGFESQCVHFGHPSAEGCQRSTGDPRLIPGKGYKLIVLGGYGRTDPLLKKPFYPNGLVVGILTDKTVSDDVVGEKLQYHAHV